MVCIVRNLITRTLRFHIKQYKLNEIGIAVIEWFRKPLRKALRESQRFEEPSHIEKTAEEASEIASTGNQCGEGWLLTGEMIELIKSGATNIACPSAVCLPAEPCNRKGHDESDQRTVSEGEYCGH